LPALHDTRDVDKCGGLRIARDKRQVPEIVHESHAHHVRFLH
jgi:hypothetical protein